MHSRRLRCSEKDHGKDLVLFLVPRHFDNFTVQGGLTHLRPDQTKLDHIRFQAPLNGRHCLVTDLPIKVMMLRSTLSATQQPRGEVLLDGPQRLYEESELTVDSAE